MARQGNNPKRRVGALRFTPEERQQLAARLTYVGSGYHKRFPAVYGFGSSAGPRPAKSVCDGIRVIPKDEAEQLLRDGVLLGMVSEQLEQGFPTYVWSVDSTGEAYEAKTHPNDRGKYHGYRLEEDDPMRELVLKVWKQRCQLIGR
jgi:hypothetical protein